MGRILSLPTKRAAATSKETIRMDEHTEDYQAPAIEEVISEEDLEREISYAGVVGSNPSTR